LIFTSDAPFRYVGCTGPTNEDDYEGHEYQVIQIYSPNIFTIIIINSYIYIHKILITNSLIFLQLNP
jgi:hypothetical protein